MNRLTKDLNTPHDDTTYSDIVRNCCDRENIVLTKLKHYEDIEEELGIDLITLFKTVLTKTIWNNNTKQYEWVDLHYSCHHFVLSTDRCLYTHDCDCLLEFKDYGKTWALTKEELEK